MTKNNQIVWLSFNIIFKNRVPKHYFNNLINFIVSLIVSMSLSLRTISASSFNLFIISSITSWHQQCRLGLYIFISKKTFNINKCSVLLLDTILTLFNNTYYNILIKNYAYLNSSFILITKIHIKNPQVLPEWWARSVRQAAQADSRRAGD